MKRRTRRRGSPRESVVEQSLEVTREEIAQLENQIKTELAKVKDRLTELQQAKKAAEQMYDAACTRLGILRSSGGLRGASPDAATSLFGRRATTGFCDDEESRRAKRSTC